MPGTLFVFGHWHAASLDDVFFDLFTSKVHFKPGLYKQAIKGRNLSLTREALLKDSHIIKHTARL